MTNGQRRRSGIEATLRQGLTLRAERGAAGQFWTFTMSNSKASSFAETHVSAAAVRMHVTLTRAASGGARHFHRQQAGARVALRTQPGLRRLRKLVCVRAGACSENLGFLELFRAISVPPACQAEGFGPPPVSPVFLNPIRVASAVIGNRHSSHTRRHDRSTDHSVARWRRRARSYMGLYGTSGSSSCR